LIPAGISPFFGGKYAGLPVANVGHCSKFAVPKPPNG
jgi:hypothetical protein